MTGPGGKGDLNSDINVTPLVDVMLVLLIIFMVTAPMMSSGVDLQLPQAEGALLEDDMEGKLILSLDRKGGVFLGEVPVPWNELEVKLSTNAKVIADRELYIEADATLPYGTVIQVMAIAKKAGVQKLLMMTDPVDTLPPPMPPPSGEPARQ
jgi:biopolymer transport protein TolR